MSCGKDHSKEEKVAKPDDDSKQREAWAKKSPGCSPVVSPDTCVHMHIPDGGEE